MVSLLLRLFISSLLFVVSFAHVLFYVLILTKEKIRKKKKGKQKNNKKSVFVSILVWCLLRFVLFSCACWFFSFSFAFVGVLIDLFFASFLHSFTRVCWVLDCFLPCFVCSFSLAVLEFWIALVFALSYFVIPDLFCYTFCPFHLFFACLSFVSVLYLHIMYPPSDGRHLYVVLGISTQLLTQLVQETKICLNTRHTKIVFTCSLCQHCIPICTVISMNLTCHVY